MKPRCYCGKPATSSIDPEKWPGAKHLDMCDDCITYLVPKREITRNLLKQWYWSRKPHPTFSETDYQTNPCVCGVAGIAWIEEVLWPGAGHLVICAACMDYITDTPEDSTGV